jgi:hypothetical protein
MAVQFGTTRDGSSLFITVYDGDDKDRTYIADSVDFDDAIDKVLQGVRVHKNGRNGEKIRAIGD